MNGNGQFGEALRVSYTTDERVTELQRERTLNSMSRTTTFPEMPVEFHF